MKFFFLKVSCIPLNISVCGLQFLSYCLLQPGWWRPMLPLCTVLQLSTLEGWLNRHLQSSCFFITLVLHRHWQKLSCTGYTAGIINCWSRSPFFGSNSPLARSGSLWLKLEHIENNHLGSQNYVNTKWLKPFIHKTYIIHARWFTGKSYTFIKLATTLLGICVNLSPIVYIYLLDRKYPVHQYVTP